MKHCKTRTSAIKRKAKYYKTGEPCSRGHVSHRFTSTRRCVACDSINKKDRYNQVKVQTPPWANLEAIEMIYAESAAMGADWHVDHIIPLQGKYVSGLHIATNLIIIPRLDNLKKQNKVEETL